MRHIISMITMSMVIFIPFVTGGKATPPPPPPAEYLSITLPAYGGANTMAVRDGAGVYFLAYIGESHPAFDSNYKQFRARLFQIFPNKMALELTHRLPGECQSEGRPHLDALPDALYWTVTNISRICAAYAVPQWTPYGKRGLADSDVVIPDDAIPWPIPDEKVDYPFPTGVPYP